MKGSPTWFSPLLPGDVEGLIEKAPEHRLPIKQAIAIAKSVCLGLEYAHSKRIVHRDLKPGNVWLSADGTVKVGDFGPGDGPTPPDPAGDDGRHASLHAAGTGDGG
jgi:serine/threonine protein kinase